MCINAGVLGQGETGGSVDNECRKLTQDIEDGCKYFKNFLEKCNDQEDSDNCEFKGVYTLEDLKELGQMEGICPYFLARRFLLKADVIVYNYSYMIDPKIANIVSRQL